MFSLVSKSAARAMLSLVMTLLIISCEPSARDIANLLNSSKCFFINVNLRNKQNQGLTSAGKLTNYQKNTKSFSAYARVVHRVPNFKQNSRRSAHHSRQPNTSIVAIGYRWKEKNFILQPAIYLSTAGDIASRLLTLRTLGTRYQG